MSTSYRYIKPLDVLILRSNQLFGDSGSFGEALMPPWPSVAAGSIRSKILSDKGVDLRQYARGLIEDKELGTPDNPGGFMISHFYLARCNNNQPEILVTPPADLIIGKSTEGNLNITKLTPCELNPNLVKCSYPLPQVPILKQDKRTKPERGYWLTQEGWQNYLNGKSPGANDLLPSQKLWSLENRVGIGMTEEKRAAEAGKLFTTQTIILHKNIGFLTGIEGCSPPKEGLLRFGGDGRAAMIKSVGYNQSEPDYKIIANEKRCKIVLTSPGLFENGWLVTGADSDGYFECGSIKARLVSACVPRSETVSGWDLALQKPKPAEKVVPTGSVYWLDQIEATEGKLEDALRKLVKNGLWQKPSTNNQRKAEGYNRLAIAAWHRD